MMPVPNPSKHLPGESSRVGEAEITVKARRKSGTYISFDMSGKRYAWCDGRGDQEGRAR